MILSTPGLGDIQGNILKGHGRKHTALVFFRFAARNADAFTRNRRLLRHAAAGRESAICLTSAKVQQMQTRRWKKNPRRRFSFRSLGLTGQGLCACGFKASDMELPGVIASDQFWSGASPGLLNDGGEWHAAFARRPDGVFLVAHPSGRMLARLVRGLKRLLKKRYGVGWMAVERGFRWIPEGQDGEPAACEPFGFADGFARTVVRVPPDSKLAGLPGLASLRPPSGPEPYEVPIEQLMITDSCVFQGGSFLVIHKLEQNVRAFLEAEKKLEERMHLLPPEVRPASAGALFIGRERSGLPLADGVVDRGAVFSFDADAGGRRCPFSAHVRKMNPRQSAFSGEMHPHAAPEVQPRAQFVRRGVVYGPARKLRLRWENPAKAPTGGVGLLFMGYMAHTGGQFLNLLTTWAPAPHFPQYGSGADILLDTGNGDWSWPAHPEFSAPGWRPGQMVVSRGAAFFLVPPLTWLRRVK